MGNALLWPLCKFRAFVYDALILKLTTKWYEVVLCRLDEGSIVLDVGIGTAGALTKIRVETNIDWEMTATLTSARSYLPQVR
jgi:hypothetical protein